MAMVEGNNRQQFVGGAADAIKSWSIFIILCFQGDSEKALSCLEHAIDQHAEEISRLRTDMSANTRPQRLQYAQVASVTLMTLCSAHYLDCGSSVTLTLCRCCCYWAGTVSSCHAGRPTL